MADEQQYAAYPGLGDDEYPGFPAEACPEVLPDLSTHHSLLADLFKRDPGLYDQLRPLSTPLGVSLAKCIKTGIDNRGHPMVKTIGLVAGDEHCYETFRQLFVPVIESRYGVGCLNQIRTARNTLKGLTSVRVDPSGSGMYVLSTQVRAARCLRGFRFPPAVSKDERREVERLIVSALQKLDGDLKGDYFPLKGSTSFSTKPTGMTDEQEQEFRRAHLLFDWPDAPAVLSSGVGRHWPDGRGLFVNNDRTFAAWVNEEEHVRAIGMRSGDAVQDAFLQTMAALNSVEDHIMSSGHTGFAHDQHLGFLNSWPSNIGTALRVSIIARLPLVTAKDRWMEWASHRGLSVRSAVDETGVPLEGLLEVSNVDKLGVSEVEIVNCVVEAVAELVKAEQRLENGEFGLDVSPEKIERLLAVTPESKGDAEDPAWAMAGETFSAAFHQAVEVNAAEAIRVDLDSMKTNMLDVLQSASDLGELYAALQAQEPLSRPHPEGVDVEGLKAKAMDALQHAAESGALEMALHEIKKEQFDESDVNDVDILKTKMRDVLVNATVSGHLEVALDEICQYKDDGMKEQPPLEAHVSAQIMDLLSTAADNGSLENALVEIQDEKDAQELPGHVMGLLDRAAESGELEHILGLLRNLQEDETETEDTKDLSSHMMGLLERAADSGELEGLLSLLRDVQDSEESKVVEEIPKDPRSEKDLLKEHLTAALDSGALEEALRTAHEARVDKGTKQLLKKRLSDAADSGDLEKALGAMREQRKDKDDSALECFKVKVKDLLIQASASGKLEEALKAVDSAEEILEAREDLAKHVFDVLDRAADSGDLEKLMEEIDKQRVVADQALALAVFDLLGDAAESGALESVLEDLSVEKLESLEALAQTVYDMLNHAADSGALEDVLEKVLAEGADDSQQSVPEAGASEERKSVGDAESLRERVKGLLVSAAKSGDLEQALSTVCQDPSQAAKERAGKKAQEEYVFELKDNLREMLLNAVESGALEKALQDLRLERVDDEKEAQPESSVDELKESVRGLLQRAAVSGHLASALAAVQADAKDSTADETDANASQAAVLQHEHVQAAQATREEVRDLLVNSADNGRLAQALAEVSDTKEQEEGQSEDVFKLDLRKALLESMDSGDLAKAVKEVRAEKDAQQSEELRKDMRQALLDSMDTGDLARILSEVHTEKEMDVLQDLRAHVKDIFFTAVDSGALEDALAGAAEEKASDETQNELRLKVRDCLLEAADSGKLEMALEDACEADADDVLKNSCRHALLLAAESGALEVALDEARQASLEKMKSKMRQTLVDAAAEGRLEDAIKQDEQQTQNLKLEVSKLLAKAADSGDLDKLLAEVKGQQLKRQQEAAEGAKEKVRHLLMSSCENGDLKAALDELTEAKVDASSCPLLELKNQVRDILVRAADDGSLRQALHELQPCEEQTQEREEPFIDLKTRTQALLYNAVENGALEAALKDLRRVQGGSPTKTEGSPHLESARMNARAALEAALEKDDDGNEASSGLDNICVAAQQALEAALAEDEVPHEEDDPAQILHACKSAREALEAALDADSEPVANEEMEVAEKSMPGDADAIVPLVLPSPPPVPHLDVSKVGKVPGALLEAVSTQDRRIGALLAMIKDTEKQIAAREESSVALEAELATARRDSEVLDEELKRIHTIMDQAEDQNLKLQESKMQLSNSLDEETLKQRHATLELDMLMYTGRSEASTACTVSDLMGTPLGHTWSTGPERPQAAITGF